MNVVKGIVISSLLLIVFTILALSGALSPPERPPIATRDTQDLVMQECAKAVLDGTDTVTMRHLARMDDCAKRVRAALLAR